MTLRLLQQPFITRGCKKAHPGIVQPPSQTNLDGKCLAAWICWILVTRQLFEARSRRGSLFTSLKRLCENLRGTVICRLGRVACPRSSVALSTFTLFNFTLNGASYGRTS